MMALAHESKAQLYRCEPSDKTAFTDQPCPSNAHRAELQALPQGPKSRIVFDVETAHDTVSGGHFKKALASLRAGGPNGHAGQARWQVSHRYRSRAESDRCRIFDATIHVKSPILMPALDAAVTGEAR